MTPVRTTIESPGRRRSPVVTAFAAVLAINAVGLVLVRLLSSGQGEYTYRGLAFTPYALAPVLVALLVCVALRRPVPAIACAVSTMVLAALVAPRVIGDDQPVVAPGSPGLTVASVNLFYGQADARAVVELVRSERIDVLSLQELAPYTVEALDVAGLGELLPYRHVEAVYGAAGGGVVSRYPLAVLPSDTTSYHHQPAVRLTLPTGGRVDVVAAHPATPASRVTGAEWAAELAAMPDPYDPAGVPRLLVGDFNATLDHRPLRRLLGRGYLDAADVTGQGLAGTWPADTRVPPLVVIDHVLAPLGSTVADYRVHAIPNSDHRAISARITLGPPPG